ncbi:MAG: DegT/DnrJ/EryC1/StrS family aminotransferase [Deltaproteobacteria bacterium]|nr:DegT/DnrJ/EryC1/StrS family aminotransferase [Deltaproteobacteria bacterium]
MNKTGGPIPFLDLITPHMELEKEIIESVREALMGGRFIGGSAVEGFEREFAAYTGAKHAIGVGSGTDALRFALMAADLKEGDTVLTVPNSFIATTEAITQAGLKIDFVDVDAKTCNMAPEKLEEYLENRCVYKNGSPVSRKTGTRVSAVIPVHLYGQMAQMDEISEISSRSNLVVIEDACQAHGAQYFSKKHNMWEKAGAIGFAGAFSFYPGKNLGACGEAGAVTTNSDEAADKIRMLRDHGQSKKYYHEIEGFNGRLDAIQASILKIKLRLLPAWTVSRRSRASLYNELLSGIESVVTPYEPEWSKAVYHLYVIRAKNRGALQKSLAAVNIATALHYPVPLHLQRAYSHFGYAEGSFPSAEKAAVEILSLPMFPGLTDEQVGRVSAAIRDSISL